MSFEYPFRGKAWWIILLLCIPVLLVFYFFDPGKLLIFPKCPLYTFTGLYCPGCGSQRAIHSFLHFRFAEVVRDNFLLFPAAMVILYHISRPLLNRMLKLNLPNILYHRKAPWIILIIVFIFWILRNIPFYPFNLLAPV